MKLLIKNIEVVDPTNKFNGSKDILIENGLIKDISKSINEKKLNIFRGEGFFLSAGFIDVHTHLRDPGFEYKEDLKSGGIAALHGG